MVSLLRRFFFIAALLYELPDFPSMDGDRRRSFKPGLTMPLAIPSTVTFTICSLSFEPPTTTASSSFRDKTSMIHLPVAFENPVSKCIITEVCL
jgi:hypothetical protein